MSQRVVGMRRLGEGFVWVCLAVCVVVHASNLFAETARSAPTPRQSGTSTGTPQQAGSATPTPQAAPREPPGPHPPTEADILTRNSSAET